MFNNLDPFNIYFQQIRLIPPITKQEKIELWKRIKKGDKKAKERMIKGNLKLVISVARRYATQHGASLMDLIQEGSIGLIKGIEKYNLKKGYQFSTYAYYWIDHFIRRYVNEQQKTIRIPPYAVLLLGRWLKTWAKFYKKFGRQPTISEMAHKLHISASKIKSIILSADTVRYVSSLDSPIGEDEDTSLKDMVSEKEEHSPEYIIQVLKTNQSIEKVLSQLKEKEATVIRKRFGISTDSKTLEEIGKELDLSRERIRQIEKRALLMMKHIAQRMNFI